LIRRTEREIEDQEWVWVFSRSDGIRKKESRGERVDPYAGVTAGGEGAGVREGGGGIKKGQ